MVALLTVITTVRQEVEPVDTDDPSDVLESRVLCRNVSVTLDLSVTRADVFNHSSVVPSESAMIL